MTLPAPSRPDALKALTERLLDRGYVDATRQVVAAIDRNSSAGVMATRLEQFQAEAQRLADAGERMKPDNPVFRALLADFETALRRDAALIDAAAGEVAQSGMNAAGTLTRALALPGMSDGQLAQVGIRWNQPNPDQVAAVVDYTNRPALRDELDAYPGRVLDVAQRVAVRGTVDGWGPLRQAAELRRIVTDLPPAYANSLMRSLQLTAWRDATALHQVANADIIEEVIRISALDSRTCMACVALHGTRLAVGERVDDHRNGRCTSISVVKGLPRGVRTGVEWFETLSEERQQAQMGEAAWRAWQAGDIRLQDLAKREQDKVFGPVVVEASLKGLLGEQAKRHYAR